jgi:hypothetical protein
VFDILDLRRRVAPLPAREIGPTGRQFAPKALAGHGAMLAFRVDRAPAYDAPTPSHPLSGG